MKDENGEGDGCGMPGFRHRSVSEKGYELYYNALAANRNQKNRNESVSS